MGPALCFHSLWNGRGIRLCRLSPNFRKRGETSTQLWYAVRNRKGHLPHIVVVTGEPMPSRLASIALGTGNIDCVYHSALPELAATLESLGLDDAEEMLAIMVDGKRLRDIADLPLDLAV